MRVVDELIALTLIVRLRNIVLSRTVGDGNDIGGLVSTAHELALVTTMSVGVDRVDVSIATFARIARCAVGLFKVSLSHYYEGKKSKRTPSIASRNVLNKPWPKADQY